MLGLVLRRCLDAKVEWNQVSCVDPVLAGARLQVDRVHSSGDADTHSLSQCPSGERRESLDLPKNPFGDTAHLAVDHLRRPGF